MKKLVYSLLLINFYSSIIAQTPCLHFESLLEEAKKEWKIGHYESALNQLAAAREHCPEKGSFVDQHLLDFTNRISQQYIEAKRQKENAERTTLEAYANDLAYKSKIALRDGKLNDAVILADFSLEYVLKNHQNSLTTLFNAVHHNRKYPSEYFPRSITIEGFFFYAKHILFIQDSILCEIHYDPNSRTDVVSFWDISNGLLVENIKHSAVTQMKIDSLVKSPIAHPPTSIIVTGDSLASGESILIRHAPTLGGPLLLEYTRSGMKTDSLVHRGVLNPHLYLAPNGKILATISAGNIISLWDLNSKKLKLEMASDQTLQDMVFSAKGDYLAVSTYIGSVELWDVQSGNLITTLPGHTGRIQHMMFSESGKYFATASRDNTIKIWHLESSLNRNMSPSKINSNLFTVFKGELVNTDTIAPENITGASFFSNSSSFFTGQEIGLNDLEFGPEGKIISVVSDGNEAIVWNFENGSQILSDRHQNFISCIRFAPKGNIVAISSYDSTISIWNTETGRLLGSRRANFGYPIHLEFFHDGAKLIATYIDTTALIWETNLAKPHPVDTIYLKGHSRQGAKIEFSRNGNYFISNSYRNGANIWGTKCMCVKKTLIHQNRYHPPLLELHSNDEALIFSDANRIIRILDLELMKQKDTIILGNVAHIRQIKLSPNGQYLAAISNDYTLYILELNPLKIVGSYKLGKASSIKRLEFSPDGKMILELHRPDQTVLVREFSSGKIMFSIESGNSQLNDAIFSPSGKFVVTASQNGKLERWEITHSGLINEWKESGPIAALRYPDLKEYGLEYILDLHPDNETKLIATQEAWQIKAFGDLAASQAYGSTIIKTEEPHFERADRLYTAALALQDEDLIRRDHAWLLRRWAEVCEVNERQEKATELRARAMQLWEKDEVWSWIYW